MFMSMFMQRPPGSSPCRTQSASASSTHCTPT
jgi:hypothetical protein